MWGNDTTAHSHRAKVLVAASFLDIALSEALNRKFVSIPADDLSNLYSYQNNGPLSTIANKIAVAYAPGIFHKMFKDDLKILVIVRNFFSHSLDYVDFSGGDIIGAVDQLYFPKYGYVRDPKVFFGSDAGGEPHDVVKMETPLQKFTETCHWLCARLLGMHFNPTSDAMISDADVYRFLPEFRKEAEQ